MPITSVEHDEQQLTIHGSYEVAADVMWDAWADPSAIEQFFGPPSWPATFERHDMFIGGRSHCSVTGPNGELSASIWEFTDVEVGKGFEVRSAFAYEDFSPDETKPGMHLSVVITPTAQGCELLVVVRFDTADDAAALLGEGMADGFTAALAQLDGVCAEIAASHREGATTQLRRLSDNKVRLSRLVRGPIERVWEAQTTAELMRRWLLGPPGWSMPVCEMAVEVGDEYRRVWKADTDDRSFGFTGNLLEVAPPFRSVETEAMIGYDGEPVVNELALRPVSRGTLLVATSTFDSAEALEQIIESGMLAGVEASYARLESLLLDDQVGPSESEL